MAAPHATLPPPHERWLEDYPVGAAFDFGPIELTEPEIISFAERYDPQTMHIDPVASAAGPYGGVIASGWNTVGLLTRLFVLHYLSRNATLPSPGVDELRWHLPVRPGDQLRLRVSVAENRASRSKPDRGILVSALEGRNQAEEVVCTLRIINLMLRRPASQPM